MVKIIADTTSSIPVEVALRLGIPYLPQIIIFGDESYRDDCEIDTNTFLKKLRASSVLPKTAAPPPALYAPFYKKLSSEGHTILVLTPSAKVSGTFRSAEVAAKDFPDADIRVMDTGTVAAGLGSIVLLANDWANNGLDADTIIQRVQEMVARERIFLVVDTLEYLYKGGRIGGAQALVGSLLQVKPILTWKDGQVESFESQRTHKRAVARLRELVYTECPPSPEAYLCVMHGGVEKEANELAEEFRKTMGLDRVPIYELPPAILTHSGPGPLAVSYFRK